MIEHNSTLNKTETIPGEEMIHNITQTDTLLMAFADSLWNVGTGIVSSILLT